MAPGHLGSTAPSPQTDQQLAVFLSNHLLVKNWSGWGSSPRPENDNWNGPVSKMEKKTTHRSKWGSHFNLHRNPTWTSPSRPTGLPLREDSLELKTEKQNISYKQPDKKWANTLYVFPDPATSISEILKGTIFPYNLVTFSNANDARWQLSPNHQRYQKCSSFKTLYFDEKTCCYWGRWNVWNNSYLEYLEFDEGDIATDARTPLLREPPPPDAGFLCRADEERSEGGSPRPWGEEENKNFGTSVLQILDDNHYYA